MPCLLGCLAIAFPRFTLALMWLFGYTGRAFDTYLWPLLGFFFMPFTTCAYAIALNEFGGIRGAGLALLIIGVLLDFGGQGGGGAKSYQYYYVRRRR